ncbi:MAG TPA: molybdopterin-dependent oxidoreductase [Actinotalea sp.]
MTTPRRREARLLAALAGVLAAALTLCVAGLAAALLAPGAEPLVAVGDAFIDVTPGWLKEAAIAAFGVNDKTALLVSAGVVLAVLAGGAGVLALRSRGGGTAAVLLLGTVGALTAATRPDAAPLAAVPSLAGAAAGVVALRALVDRVDPAPASSRTTRTSPAAAGPRSPDRRGFLRGALMVTAIAAASSAAASLSGGATKVATAAREALHLPAPKRSAPPVPAGAQSPVAGVGPVVTPNQNFYRIDTALSFPRVDPAKWAIRIHGMVEREVTLTLDDLLAGDLVEAYVTLACVSNPVGGRLLGNARWLGLPVADVLTRAGVLPGADMVLSTSVDGFTASTPLAVLLDGRDALLAVGMNGEPLPLAHGFPVRMVVPGLYGYVSATKWLDDLEVTRFADQEAYWTQRGWSPLGPVKTSSRIEVPRDRDRLSVGTVAVGGTAWAQHTGITGVEVQVDDGPWRPATVADEISVDSWRQWSFSWDARAGDHTLRVRATDATGTTQTSDVADVIPDGATGWHEISVTVG